MSLRRAGRLRLRYREGAWLRMRPAPRGPGSAAWAPWPPRIC